MGRLDEVNLFGLCPAVDCSRANVHQLRSLLGCKPLGVIRTMVTPKRTRHSRSLNDPDLV